MCVCVCVCVCVYVCVCVCVLTCCGHVVLSNDMFVIGYGVIMCCAVIPCFAIRSFIVLVCVVRYVASHCNKHNGLKGENKMCEAQTRKEKLTRREEPVVFCLISRS